MGEFYSEKREREKESKKIRNIVWIKAVWSCFFSNRKLHTMDLEDTSDWSKTKVEKSLTEQSALDEFLTTAEMAGKEFESGRLH